MLSCEFRVTCSYDNFDRGEFNFDLILILLHKYFEFQNNNFSVSDA